MLTHLKIRNFKRFDNVDIDLDNMVVFIGPNNSGKSTALQALALWDVGLKRWIEERKGETYSKQRPAVTINRRDLISIPIPTAKLLWRDLHVRKGEQINDKPVTKNILIEIVVSGIHHGKTWDCGLEFDYANPESLYCRPLRLNDNRNPPRMPVPIEASEKQVAYLPPMSGLASVEPKWEPGRINVLTGEGQTAQVLRNLCYGIYENNDKENTWLKLTEHIRHLFGVELLPPEFNIVRGEITMAYRERSGLQLDLSSSGRGMQQVLLLLAHLYANKNTVLLLDEPDAHLEILRQRQIYHLISSIAEKQDSQIIAASHSEIVLNEACGKDTVVAFIGKPHSLTDRPGQVLKSLTDIGFDLYYQAEIKGWILYLEGSTDLDILRTFAKTLNHPVAPHLEDPFFDPVTTNLPQKARDKFFGLREAKKDLVGIAIFDRLDKELHQRSSLIELMWRKREIENYLCTEEVLLAYARYDLRWDIFGKNEQNRRVNAMRESIEEISNALRTLKNLDPWSPDLKVTDDFLNPLFNKYFERLEMPNMLRKSKYHILARFVPQEMIDPEIIEKLNAIYSVVQSITPSAEI